MRTACGAKQASISVRRAGSSTTATSVRCRVRIRGISSSAAWGARWSQEIRCSAWRRSCDHASDHARGPSPYPRLTILHIDAHCDIYHAYQGNPRSHASPFARIMEERLADRLIQVGTRTINDHHREQFKRFGVEVIEAAAASGSSRFGYSRRRCISPWTWTGWTRRARPACRTGSRAGSRRAR